MRVAVPQTTKARVAALCRGISASGDELVPVGQSAPVAVASNWGSVLELYGMGYARVALCECGYLGNRNAWCSLSWDGLNGRGIHALAPERPDPHLDPWRGERAGYALLLGQVPTDWAVRLALRGFGYAEWLEEVTRELELRGFTVRYRPHPEVSMADTTLTKQPPSLREELGGARIAVTLNSTSAIDAVCAGVPTVVWDELGCMAAPVATKISTSERFAYSEPLNRRSWANTLARLQWSMDELETGSAWRALVGVL